MREEIAFLSAIRENPDDDAPRLIFADWLEEHGQPERAEFIRVQCELERRTSDDPHRQVLETREAELFQAHRGEWEQPLCDLGVTEVEFRRGFPHHIAITAQAFLDHAPQFFALAPIQSARITEVTADRLEPLAASQHLRNLATLNLESNYIGDAGVAALANSPHLRNLATLNLESNHIADVGVAALANSPHLHNLTTLDLSGNYISDAGVAALAGSENFRNLTELNLLYNRIGDAGAEGLARSENLRNLTTLNLVANANIPQATLHNVMQMIADRSRDRQRQ